MKSNMNMLVLALLLFGCNSGEEEVIVVPQGFKGYILIIYDQSEGTAEKKVNGKRYYEIPPNGILKTRFSRNVGFRPFTEYYDGNVSERSKITSYHEFSQIPPDVVAGFMGASGSSNIDLQGSHAIEYVLHYVGTREDIIKAIKEAESLDVKAIAD